MPSARRTSAIVTTIVPTASGRGAPSGSRDSSSNHGPTMAIAIPIGTFTTNTERHPHASTKRPPRVGPSAAASAPAAPQSAIACGTRGAGKLRRIRANDAGVRAAAPSPCRILAATRTPAPGAGGDGTDGRRDGEESQPCKEHTAPTQAVGPPAGRDHSRRDDDRVAGEDPRQRRGAHLRKVATDAAERDVEDHRIERGDEG